MSFHLPGGLRAARVQSLSDLIGDITGMPLNGFPYLGPTLFFSDPAVQSALAFPETGQDHVLVQDYQGLAFAGPFPLDTDLTASVDSETSDNNAALSVRLASHDREVSTLTTKLRRVRAGDLATLKPAVFQPETLGNTHWGAAIRLTQTQIDRYVQLSGDKNPIHADPALTCRMGFANTVVPGLLLIALLQPLCERHLTDATLVSLKARFLSPLMTGAQLKVGVQDRGSDPRTGQRRQRAYCLDADDRGLALVDLLFSA